MAEVQREDEIQGRVIHVYDGIEEADNDLPRWWLVIFIGSVVFGVGYWLYYHEYEMGLLPRDELAAQLAERGAAFEAATDEELVALSSDDAAVAEGRSAFQTNCVACHAAEAEGMPNLGPNLTDEFWIHGGAPTDIHRTISEGVLTKGMPAWIGPLGNQGTRNVVAYILTLRNTHVEGQPPQGERWPPGSADDAETAEPEDTEAPPDPDSTEDVPQPGEPGAAEGERP